MACDTPGWTHVTLNVLQENLLGFYFLFDVSKLSKLSLAFYFFTDFLTWNRHSNPSCLSDTSLCSGFSWCPCSLAMIFSCWRSGSVLWAPDSWPDSQPLFHLKLWLLGSSILLLCDLNRVLFSFLLFSLWFYLTTLTDHCPSTGEAILSFWSKPNDQNTILWNSEEVFVKLFNLLMRKEGPERLSKLLQFTKSVGGWAKCRT